MIPLLDDPAHIGLACSTLEVHPDNRPAINWVVCALGESLEGTRLASLLAILLTIFLIDRTFFRDRNWKRYALMNLHPLVLTPFFWASQISTSLTTLWAALWIWLYQAWMNQKDRTGKWILFSLLSGLSAFGTLFRFEASAYAGVFLGVYFLRSTLNWRKALKAAAPGAVFLCIPAVRLITGLLQHIARPATPGTPTSGLTLVAGASYPAGSWPYLQMNALLTYCKGILLPWSISFYSDWYRWWEIETHRNREVLAFSIFLLAGVLAWWIARIVMRRIGKATESIDALASGFALFFLITAVLSGTMRTDWYYLARTYLGFLVFLIFAAPVFAKNSKFFWLIAAFWNLSSVAHITLHYSTPENFTAYESEVAGGYHPHLSFAEMRSLYNAGKKEEALQAVHRVYEKIPPGMAAVSDRAEMYWALSLYNAWVMYQWDNRIEESRKVYGILSKTGFFPSVHACLQNPEVPVESCLIRKRKDAFCDSLGSEFPKLQTVRPYRINPKDLCGFEPNQKD